MLDYRLAALAIDRGGSEILPRDTERRSFVPEGRTGHSADGEEVGADCVTTRV